MWLVMVKTVEIRVDNGDERMMEADAKDNCRFGVVCEFF